MSINLVDVKRQDLLRHGRSIVHVIHPKVSNQFTSFNLVTRLWFGQTLARQLSIVQSMLYRPRLRESNGPQIAWLVGVG